MAFVDPKDRVKETSTTTGTGDFTLAGVATGGFRTFASVYSVGNQISYCIQNTTSGEWEVGQGTYSASNTLQRDTVLASSNSNALVSFGAGTKEVFVTLAGAEIIYEQADGVINKETLNITAPNLPGTTGVISDYSGTVAVANPGSVYGVNVALDDSTTLSQATMTGIEAQVSTSDASTYGVLNGIRADVTTSDAGSTVADGAVAKLTGTISGAVTNIFSFLHIDGVNNTPASIPALGFKGIYVTGILNNQYTLGLHVDSARSKFDYSIAEAVQNFAADNPIDDVSQNALVTNPSGDVTINFNLADLTNEPIIGQNYTITKVDDTPHWVILDAGSGNTFSDVDNPRYIYLRRRGDSVRIIYDGTGANGFVVTTKYINNQGSQLALLNNMALN